MALFGFGKKEEAENCCCGKPVNGICCIKVLGAGCKSCHEQFENAKAAVSSMGLSVEVKVLQVRRKIRNY